MWRNRHAGRVIKVSVPAVTTVLTGLSEYVTLEAPPMEGHTMGNYKVTRGQMRPLINMNGDRRETLVEQRTKALNAISDALRALIDTCPHGRNYQGYPNDNQYRRDKALYDNRYNVLYELHREIERETLAIHEKEELL